MDILLQEAIMFVGLLALAGWILWLVYRRYQHRMELQRRQLELFNSVIEKFGNSGEFVSFLQSRDGRALLYPDNGAGESRSRPILRFVQAAIVLFVTGCGLFLYASSFTDRSDPNIIQKVADFHYWATVMITLAVALAIVAVVTHWWDRQGKRSENR